MPYLQVNWITEVPVARAMGWGNIVFLTSGLKPSTADNPQIVTPTNYTEYLSSSSYEYLAFGSYKINCVGTPSNTSYVYWMGDGVGITGITQKVTDISYLLSMGPFASFDKVEVDPTGGQNWQDIGAGSVSGYTARTGATAIYNGYIDFSGHTTAGGPYFESGGATYSGASARSIMTASGGLIRGEATQNGFGAAASDLKNYDIQFIVPLYNVAGDGTGLLGTPAYNDLKNALMMAAGKRREVIWALPKSASPNTSYYGTAYDYNQFRNYIGQDKNCSVIYADVATGTNLTGLDDPAGALAGRIVTAHPHIPQTLDTIVMSLASRANEGDKAAWDAGNIICVFRQTDLGFSADQLNYGFTFGATTPSDRIDNVRCKYLTEYNILQDLWKLLSSRTVRINKAGLNRTIDIIHGTLNRLKSQGIIDSGERIVDIPLLRGTAAEWTEANQTRRIPAIIIRWPWQSTVESMIITEFGEIL